MAMQVALESGIPKDIVLQATRLHDALVAMGKASFISGSHIAHAAAKSGFLTAHRPAGETDIPTASNGRRNHIGSNRLVFVILRGN